VKKGKYFRLGDFDIWLGFEGDDIGLLRIEWWGNGLRSYSIRLKEFTMNPDQSNLQPLIIKNDKGNLSVTFSENKSGTILTQLRNMKFGICWFSAVGTLTKPEQEQFRGELISCLTSS
jgi:hypothetical protein